jgi:hypothetical protein
MSLQALTQEAVRDALATLEADPPEDQEATGSRFATLEELQRNPDLLEPPECVLPRLAYRGRLSILAGPDKSGKSTLARHGTAALTRSRPFLGEPVGARHGRAVHLGLEEAVGDQVISLTELGATAGNVQLVVMAAPDLLGKVGALLEEWPADLVIVDSLQEYARVTGSIPDDGDAAGWATVVRPLVALARRFDVAVLILHHVRKSDGQYRGSTEIAAAADCLLELIPPGSSDPQNVRRIRGRARWPVEPFTVELSEGEYRMGGTGELSTEARVLIFVENNPRCSKRAVRGGVGGRAAAVDAALSTLVSRGAVENVGTGDRPAYVSAALQPGLEGVRNAS